VGNYNSYITVIECLLGQNVHLKTQPRNRIAPSNERKEAANEINFFESIGYHKDGCETKMRRSIVDFVFQSRMISAEALNIFLKKYSNINFTLHRREIKIFL